MRHRYVLTTLAVTAALLFSPVHATADLYSAEECPGHIRSYEDTVGTIVNPNTLLPGVIDMALDHEGRLLLSNTGYDSECDATLLRFDIDAQTVTELDWDVVGHVPGSVAVDLGDDIYIVNQQNWKGDGDTLEPPSGTWLGILRGGVGPAEVAYEFAHTVVTDIVVRPTGPRAGNILALVDDDGHSVIEIERTEADSFVYYGLVADSGMMPLNATGIAIDPDGTIVILDYDYGLYYIDEEYGYVWGFGSAYGPGLTDIELDSDGVIYLANTYFDWIERFDPDGYSLGDHFGGVVSLGAVAATGYTPTPVGEDVLVEPGENIEVTYEEVTSSGFTTAVVESTTSRISPEGNGLPDHAQLPGSRSTLFTYIGLSTDAIYEGLIQVDVLEEGSRLFYASGTSDTFRDFTVVGSIEDARGTIPRFNELPAPGLKRADTGPTEVVLVEDTRELGAVSLYKFWRLELAMAVPDNMPGGDPCPWEFIEWLQKYPESAREYYDAGDHANALSELAIMNGMIRSHAGWCIPDSSDDVLGNLVAKILAHSKTLMYSIELESGEPFTGLDESSSVVSLMVTNPSKGECRMTFSGPIGAEVAAHIYSVTGRLVATVYEGRLPEGGETVVWNGIDDTGRPVASGVYFARVESGGELLTSKVVYIR